MKVVNLKEMEEIEKAAIEEYGYTEGIIIENIGIRGADFIKDSFLVDNNFGELIFLIGLGENGADGLAMARNLANTGATVRCFCLWSKDEMSKEALNQLKLASGYGVKITYIKRADELESYLTQTHDQCFIVDAILGTGFRAPLSNFVFDIVEIINRSTSTVVSIDMPTGVSGETGEVSSTAIEADITLSIGLPKIGQYIGDGPIHSGELYTLDAGFPVKLLEGGDKKLLNKEIVKGLVVGRDKFAHKNRFGHTLVIGGSHGLTGALLMSSSSALKVGSGLVTAATWAESYPELCSRISPEIMTGVIPREGDDDLEQSITDLDRYSSIVIGPGLGRGEDARFTVLKILNNFSGPVVIDADAIKVLSLKDDLQVLQNRKGSTILTPHVGEFSHLVGEDKEKVLANPIGYLKELIDDINCCVILKGACSYLGFPNGEIFINYFPNDGMATGGSGDVLAGIVGGLLAQYKIVKRSSGMFEDKNRVYDAVCLGLSAHTLAGKLAADELGVRAMTAVSIIDFLGDAFFEIKSWNE